MQFTFGDQLIVLLVMRAVRQTNNAESIVRMTVVIPVDVPPSEAPRAAPWQSLLQRPQSPSIAMHIAKAPGIWSLQRNRLHCANPVTSMRRARKRRVWRIVVQMRFQRFCCLRILKRGRERYTDEQIAFVFRQAESGSLEPEIVRKMGISEPNLFRW